MRRRAVFSRTLAIHYAMLRTYRVTISALLLSVVSAAGLCAGGPTAVDAPPPARHLSQRQAVAIAVGEARRNRLDLAGYKAPEIRFVREPEPAKWIVTFKWHVDIPGGYFIVVIDDTTGAAQLHLGE